jgi:hypothetical protein
MFINAIYTVICDLDKKENKKDSSDEEKKNKGKNHQIHPQQGYYP